MELKTGFARRVFISRALMHLINRRALELSHLAYEEYRDRMQADKRIQSGEVKPEDWRPDSNPASAE